MESVETEPIEEKAMVTVKQKRKQRAKSKQKTFRAQVNCVCNPECAKNIDVSQQQEMFKEFTECGSKWSKQTQFLRRLIVSKPIQPNMDPVIKLKKRENAYEYHLIAENESLTRVCFRFFVNVFQISEKKVYNAVASTQKNPMAIDRRGSSRKNRNDSLDMKFLKKFIGTFVTYESSCNPSKANTKYLHPRLTVRRMYQLYQENCVRAGRKMLSETVFRKILKTDFNLRFVSFAKKKCKACNSDENVPGRFVQNMSALDKQQQEEMEHKNLLKKVQNDLFETVDVAMDISEKTEVFTFELHHALELPYLNTDQNGDLFHKKQLWCFCVSIFDEIRQTGYFYVWNECIASHGSQQIASCLYKHFMNHVPKEIRKIILFSDIHHGQNRNMKISLMLSHYIQLFKKKTEIESIEQRFFVKGHGFNSCTRSFQKFASNLKSNKIFVPVDINKMIQQSKFQVVEMKEKDFFSCDPLVQLIADYNEAQQLPWSDFQRIIYDRSDGFSFKAVNYSGVESRTFSIPTKYTADTYSKTKLIYLCPNGCQISKSKYDDLQNLLEYIPPENHSFYRSLNSANDDLISDYGLVSRISGGESSDEE